MNPTKITVYECYPNKELLELMDIHVVLHTVWTVGGCRKRGRGKGERKEGKKEGREREREGREGRERGKEQVLVRKVVLSPALCMLQEVPDIRRIKWTQKWIPRYFYQHIYVPMLYCFVSAYLSFVQLASCLSVCPFLFLLIICNILNFVHSPSPSLFWIPYSPLFLPPLLPPHPYIWTQLGIKTRLQDFLIMFTKQNCELTGHYGHCTNCCDYLSSQASFTSCLPQSSSYNQAELPQPLPVGHFLPGQVHPRHIPVHYSILLHVMDNFGETPVMVTIETSGMSEISCL